jgi:hypothetical protein
MRKIKWYRQHTCTRERRKKNEERGKETGQITTKNQFIIVVIYLLIMGAVTFHQDVLESINY